MKINIELYNILQKLNISEEEAREAASTDELTAIERDIIQVKTELQFHRLAFGAVIALELFILGRLFTL